MCGGDRPCSAGRHPSATAVAALERSQAARITSAEVHRSVAADLYGLLPEVIALSAAGESLADSLGVQVAQVTDGNGKPIGSLAPLPTPKPTPRPTPTPAPPKVADIKATFFGSGMTSKYKVSGNTPSEISRSIAKHGPFSDWIGGRAAAVTSPHRSIHSIRGRWLRCLSNRCGEQTGDHDQLHDRPGEVDGAVRHIVDHHPVVERRHPCDCQAREGARRYLSISRQAIEHGLGVEYLCERPTSPEHDHEGCQTEEL